MREIHQQEFGTRVLPGRPPRGRIPAPGPREPHEPLPHEPLPAAGGKASGTGGGAPTGASDSRPQPLTTDTGEHEVPSAGSGQWMHTTATFDRASTVSGRTRTWCTNSVFHGGFHWSALPVLFDATGKAIWPSDPQTAKHQYGVDGEPLAHDRTDTWTNTVPAEVARSATRLDVVQFLDPKNMLLHDLGIIGMALPEIIAIIASL